MTQIVEQSRSDKIKMYMKIPKKKLVEMLINCNDILSNVKDIHGVKSNVLQKFKKRRKKSYV